MEGKTRRDCLGHELCFVPLSNRPQSSEVWHWSGILRRHPEGSTALRSLSLHAQHKGHVWKQGKQSQQTSSPTFFGDPATHSCPAWRSSPGSLRDHTATYSPHAQEDGEMTSIVFYLYLLQLQTTEALTSLWTKHQHHPSLSRTGLTPTPDPFFLPPSMAEQQSSKQSCVYIYICLHLYM